MDAIIPVSAATNEATWFQVPLATKLRGGLSRTGDVYLYGGPRFPTSFANIADAASHARRASADAASAVAILEHEGSFHLARLSNAEYSVRAGWQLLPTVLDEATVSGAHEDLRLIVDGDRSLDFRS